MSDTEVNPELAHIYDMKDVPLREKRSKSIVADGGVPNYHLLNDLKSVGISG